MTDETLISEKDEMQKKLCRSYLRNILFGMGVTFKIYINIYIYIDIYIYIYIIFVIAYRKKYMARFQSVMDSGHLIFLGT